MRYKFTKMQSLGNDFVMLNGVVENIRITEDIARQFADRHFGIGCDQILVAQKSSTGGHGVRIFNNDGSEVGQCGNGLRCFASYLKEQGINSEKSVRVQTMTTTVELNHNADGTVTVAMGRPEFDPDKIPLAVDKEELVYRVQLEDRELAFSVISMGNPHCVIEVPGVDDAPVLDLGPVMECHPVFPQRANIGFCEYLSKSEVNLRVFERGAGETLGCGSGACAAAVVGIRRGQLDRIVKVNLPGGSVVINWPSDQAQVALTGPVHRVFQGDISL
jgi:diaminopimelate epimerase